MRRLIEPFWAVSSGSILFAKPIIIACGSERVKKERKKKMKKKKKKKKEFLNKSRISKST